MKGGKYKYNLLRQNEASNAYKKQDKNRAYSQLQLYRNTEGSQRKILPHVKSPHQKSKSPDFKKNYNNNQNLSINKLRGKILQFLQINPEEKQSRKTQNVSRKTSDNFRISGHLKSRKVKPKFFEERQKFLNFEPYKNNEFSIKQIHPQCRQPILKQDQQVFRSRQFLRYQGETKMFDNAIHFRTSRKNQFRNKSKTKLADMKSKIIEEIGKRNQLEYSSDQLQPWKKSRRDTQEVEEFSDY